MYDTGFDNRDSIPRLDRRVLWTLRIVALLTVVLASSARGQMPSTPILQNVWANSGLVGAVDFAGGPGGSVYAAAASWSPNASRFQFSGGVGMQAQTAGLGSSVAYGARIAMPLASQNANFGFGAF